MLTIHLTTSRTLPIGYSTLQYRAVSDFRRSLYLHILFRNVSHCQVLDALALRS